MKSPNGRIVEGWLLRQLPQFFGVMVAICFKIMFVGSTFCFLLSNLVGRWFHKTHQVHFLNSKIPEKELQYRLEAAGKDITQKNSLGPLSLFF